MARNTRTTLERTSTAVASTTHEEGPGAMYGARDMSQRPVDAWTHPGAC
jgi:hypothetical protein